MNKNRVIILSGPSCVGKTPLVKAFLKYYSALAAKFQKILLYNSRLPRPSEREGVDYYFRNRNEINDLRNKDNYIVMEIREDLHALDINELLQQLDKNDVLYEGNIFIGKMLLNHSSLKKIKKLSIFISPFSKDEITKLKSDSNISDLQNYIFKTMKNKLIGRAKKFNQELTEEVLENINKRARDAYSELKDAWMFDYVIPNHDGEDNQNWNEPIPPNSDALFAVKEFTIILKDENPVRSEKWKRDLLV